MPPILIDDPDSSDLSDLEIIEEAPPKKKVAKKSANTSGATTSKSASSKPAKNGKAKASGPAKPIPILTDTTTKDLDQDLKTNWEVAYVYAYLSKFTELQSLTNPTSHLQTIMDLEDALIRSSPTSEQLVVTASALEAMEDEHERLEADRVEAHNKRLSEIAKELAAARAARALKKEGDDEDQSIDEARPEVGEEGATSPARSVSSLSSLSAVDDFQAKLNGEHAVVEETPTAPTSAPIASTSAATISDGITNEAPVASNSDVVPTSAPAPALIIADDAFRSPLIIAIIKTLQKSINDELSFKKRDWYPWLLTWTAARMREGICFIKWESNYLVRPVWEKKVEGESEDLRWWRLSWADKIHLIRMMCDWALSYSLDARKILDEAYVTGKQRVIKRDPSDNRLVILEVGRLNNQSIWHLDNSPRVYASSFGPYDTPTVWNVLTTTIDEYVHYFSTLADPGQSSKRALASIFKKTNAHSSKSLGDSNGASSSRGKAGDDDATKLKKRSSRVVDDSEESEEEDLKMNKELAAQFHVRTILEGRLPAVKAAKIAIADLAVAKVEQAERIAQEAEQAALKAVQDAIEKAEHQPRAMRSTVLTGDSSNSSEAPGPTDRELRATAALLNPGTRSSRAVRVSYAQFENGEDDFLTDEENGEGSGRRGKGKGKAVGGKRSRRLRGDGAEDDDEEIDELESSLADEEEQEEDELAPEKEEPEDEREYSDQSEDEDKRRGRGLGKATIKKNALAAAGGLSTSPPVKVKKVKKVKKQKVEKAEKPEKVEKPTPEWRGERRSNRRRANEDEADKEMEAADVAQDLSTPVIDAMDVEAEINGGVVEGGEIQENEPVIQVAQVQEVAAVVAEPVPVPAPSPAPAPAQAPVDVEAIEASVSVVVAEEDKMEE